MYGKWDSHESLIRMLLDEMHCPTDDVVADKKRKSLRKGNLRWSGADCTRAINSRPFFWLRCSKTFYLMDIREGNRTVYWDILVLK